MPISPRALWDRLPFVGRLLVTASFALVVAGLAMLYVSARGEAEESARDLDLHLHEELAVLPQALAETVVIGDYATLQQSLERHAARRDISAIRFRDAAGSAMEAVDKPLPRIAPAWFVAWSGLADASGEVALVVGGKHYGTLYITLAATTAVNRVWGRLEQHLFILLLAVALDFLGIWLVLRNGLRPLDALSKGADALARGELAIRIPPQGSPELMRVIAAFNHMAGKVAAAQDELREEAERLQVTLSSIGDGVISTSAGGRVEFMNPVAEALAGWKTAEAQGRPIGEVFAIVNETTRAAVECPVGRAVREGAVVGLANHTVLISRDGAEHPIADSAAPIRHADGSIQGAVLVFRDQSEERRLLDRLKLAASVMDNSLNGVTITDAQKRIVEVNPAFTRITGYSREEAIGQTPRLLSSGRHDAAFYAAMWRAIEHVGHWQGEIWDRHKDGEVYPQLLSVVAVRNDAGAITHYIGIFSDIRDLKAQEARLAHLAHYDPLTGLPNRALLADRMNIALAQAARAGESLAVCYLDLDGFKPVNDTYGHAAGDRLLVEVARRMHEAVRGGDTLARLGGDEFVLLLTEIEGSAECEGVLRRVEESLSRPFLIEGHPLAVTASVGVTLYPDDAEDADTLLRHADHALYAAKEAGRSRWHFFDPHHDLAAKYRRDTLGRLEQALACSEFRLHYQPKVNMHTGEVVGMEALIRWQHPERGMLPPAEFLPLLEGSEHEIALGEWVIATALAQMDIWRGQGLDVAVSVNIAPPHLARSDFAERLQGLLALHPHLPTGRLELEVLESAALADLDHVSRLIEACRRLGVSFALDDFGTGYAMLTYLRRLSADVIKIDQSFVRDMLEDVGDLAIIEGVIGLANAFHIAVIAEGVETVEHGTTLLHLGCELAQGYAIARPMPGEEVPGWVASWQPDRLWRETSTGWTRDDVILYGAEMDHRIWVGEIEAWLAGDGTPEPALLDVHMCRFGRWYHGPGRLHYGQLAEFRAIDATHRQVHALVEEIVRLHRGGRTADAQARLPELAALRDELIAHLHTLNQART